MRRDNHQQRSLRTWVLVGLSVLLVGLVGYALLAPVQRAPAPSVLLPQPTSTFKPGPLVIEAIRRQAKLETVAMFIHNDLTVSREHGLFGACSEELTYMGYFNVTAGIDLAKISADDIQVTNDGYPEQARVIVTMPPAAILHNELDTAKSRIVSQSTPRWVPGCTHQIADMTVEAQNTLRGYAESAALQQDILPKAEEYASQELERLLEAAGYLNVTVRPSSDHQPGSPTPVPTYRGP